MSYGEAKDELKMRLPGEVINEIVVEMKDAIFGEEIGDGQTIALEREDVHTLVEDFLARLHDKGFKIQEPEEE